MKWGINNSKRIEATPKAKGSCSLCGEKLIPKCGTIKIWHWSHKSLRDCDAWAEGETKWHLDWKNKFPVEMQEVIIGKHRADVKTSKGIVIEFQNSSISSEDIVKREEFYGEMVWVLNGKKLCSGLDLRRKNNIITFRWKHPPKSWWNSKKPICIDLDGLYEIRNENPDKYVLPEYVSETKSKLFFIKKIYHNIPCGGWGILINKEDFLKQFK